MNAKLEQYIARERAEIEQERQRQSQEAEALKRREREELLEKLGIYEEEREYTQEVFSNMSLAARMGYVAENKDGRIAFYKVKHVYPELTDEELAQLQALEREKEALGMTRAAAPETPAKLEKPRAEALAPVVIAAPEAEPVEYRVEASVYEGASFGGRLMKILAILLWVVGFIASIALGRDRWGGFNFGSFLALLVSFFIVGASYFAIGELFDNVSSIKGSIQGLASARLKPDKKRK